MSVKGCPQGTLEANEIPLSGSEEQMGYRSRHVPGHEEEFHIGYEGKKNYRHAGENGT